nr:hypothetical protein [Microbispora sp. GKU 823]
MPVGPAERRTGDAVPAARRDHREPLRRLPGQEAQQVERAVVGPVQVLDDEHGRSDGRQQGAYRAEHPVALGPRVVQGLRRRRSAPASSGRWPRSAPVTGLSRCAAGSRPLMSRSASKTGPYGKGSRIWWQ